MCIRQLKTIINNIRELKKSKSNDLLQYLDVLNRSLSRYEIASIKQALRGE